MWGGWWFRILPQKKCIVFLGREFQIHSYNHVPEEHSSMIKHLKSHSNPTPSALVTGMTTALWVWPRFHSMDLGHSRVPFRYGHDHCAIGMTPGIWNIRRRTTRWIRNRRQVQVRWLFRRVGAKFRQCWPRWDLRPYRDLRRARQFSLCGRIRNRWRATSDARTERKPNTRDSMES